LLNPSGVVGAGDRILLNQVEKTMADAEVLVQKLDGVDL